MVERSAAPAPSPVSFRDWSEWHHERPAGPTRRRTWVKVVAVLLALLVVLAVAAVAGGLYLQHRVTARITRIGDPFAAIPAAARPAPGAAGGQDILLVGSVGTLTPRTPGAWAADAARTQAFMVLHIPADRSAVYLTAIPRDGWVDVPGHGQATLADAYALGGPTLTIEAVEHLTGVRIDHLAVLDYRGLAALTDYVGGVRIRVPQASGGSGDAQFLSGADALNYAAAGGAAPTDQRQQNWMRGLARRATTSGVIGSPAALYHVLTTTAGSLELDDGFSAGQLRGLALSLRHLRGGDLTFLDVPTAGTTRTRDGQPVENLDPAGVASLFGATSADRLALWAADHPDDVLGDTVP